VDDWELKPARDLGLPPTERHRSLKREGGLIETVLRAAWWSSVRASLKVFHRLEVHGREHLPPEPSFVVAANHGSHADALVIGSALPLRLRDKLFPLAAGDVFFETPAVAAFAATVFNALPVWRKNCGAHALAELRQRLLEEPCAYILFPEGKRTRTGTMNPFRPGIGMLVAGTPVPVVPCFLKGTYEACPPQRIVPRFVKISMWLGRPMSFSTLGNSRAGWNTVAEATESAVKQLARAAEG